MMQISNSDGENELFFSCLLTPLCTMTIMLDLI